MVAPLESKDEMTKEEKTYYQTLERLHNYGFHCSCDANNPTSGCIICDPKEHEDIRSNPVWLDWLKKE